VLLIVDKHPVHLSTGVKRWLAPRADRLKVFFLTGYSPGLNPDEFLNQEVKSNALGRQRPATRDRMIEGVPSYLRSTQCRPVILRSYFPVASVRYAAGSTVQRFVAGIATRWQSTSQSFYTTHDESYSIRSREETSGTR